LGGDGAPFRIVGVGSILPPNTATHYGLEDARGYQAMTLARLHDTEWLWSVPQPVWSNRVDDLTRPMLSLLNVRYALAPAHAAPPAGWARFASADGFEIFENANVLPRAFVPRVVHFAPAEAVMGAMAACRDFGKESWIESGEPHTAANGRGTVDARRDGSGLLVHASMASAGWIFVSQSAWRGWRAKEYGTELPLRFGNHAFLAFYVGAGEHRITLAYEPVSFALGETISLLTLVGMVALVLLVGRRSAAAATRPLEVVFNE
jgi:hypothetical protein